MKTIAECKIWWEDSGKFLGELQFLRWRVPLGPRSKALAGGKQTDEQWLALGEPFLIYKLKAPFHSIAFQFVNSTNCPAGQANPNTHFSLGFWQIPLCTWNDLLRDGKSLGSNWRDVSSFAQVFSIFPFQEVITSSHSYMTMALFLVQWAITLFVKAGEGVSVCHGWRRWWQTTTTPK